MNSKNLEKVYVEAVITNRARKVNEICDEIAQTNDYGKVRQILEKYIVFLQSYNGDVELLLNQRLRQIEKQVLLKLRLINSETSGLLV